MIDFNILINNPELAKSVKFEITGNDLLNLASTLIRATKDATKLETKDTEVYVDINEATRQLKRNKSTLWKWGKDGVLKHNAMGLYKQSDITAILNK